MKKGKVGLNAANICPEMPLTPQRPGNEVAIVACGWFWHPQLEWSEKRGVTRCVVGYSGGDEPDPTYQSIKVCITTHYCISLTVCFLIKDYTEAVMIEFDPNIISYQDILNLWQESDTPYYPQKCQYRSALFYIGDKQRKQAEEYVQKLNDDYAGKGKLYIDVEPAKTFYRGEEYHQNFLVKQRSSSFI